MPSRWSTERVAGVLARLLLPDTYYRQPCAPQGAGATDVLVQLRIAEYQALTTRITYWITIQYSIGGAIAVAVVDFLKPLPSGIRESALHVWSVVLVIEALVGAFNYTLYEIMSDSEYLENELARKIRTGLPGERDFWEYERFRRHKNVYAPEGMYLLMGLCVSAPYIALLYFRPWDRAGIDAVCTVLSVAIAAWSFHIARTAVSAQRRILAQASKSGDGG